MLRQICFAALMAVVVVRNASAQAATRLAVAPRSTLSLAGSSNVAAWRCTGNTLLGAMEIAAPIDRINDVIDRIENGDIAVWMADPARARFPRPQFELEIPIDALRCSGGKPMERDLHAALKAGSFPSIRFELRELRGAVTHDIDAHTYEAHIVGELSIAGATRPLEIVASAQRVARDRFRLRAVMPLKMTDFGIVPPRALFGLVRAADDLTVTFDLLLETRS